ncbi:unnamed protein product [Cylindrotheca closterium]|uniref:MYND-type domain-containing protein n=1 Tax=Cylindrotheca closterium TaxID=2856 RepID=A0AAD2CIW9_9STRA|nr:unnamed protein product [Cylindrotheca closterium]
MNGQYTFQSTSAANPSWFTVTLPDGTYVDIGTKQGAEDFLCAASGVECFSSKLQEISRIRNKKKWNANDRDKLFELYSFIERLAGSACPEVFRRQVPELEIRNWLENTIEDIKKLSAKRGWIRGGDIDDVDRLVLESCIAFFQHAVPLALAFEGPFFQAFAAFVKARKRNGRDLPAKPICLRITAIVYFAVLASKTEFDSKWDQERVFKKLEASGILEQVIRCLTVSQPPEDATAGDEIIRNLQACPLLISKQFMLGKPCGDTLRMILDGKDGSRKKQPQVINAFQNLVRLSDSAVKAPKFRDETLECGNCGKEDILETFMTCSRCHGQIYCSKEYQRADWRKHKTICADLSKTKRDEFDIEQMTLAGSNFLNKHGLRVLDKMVEMCTRTGLKAGDMVTELSWKNDGVIPTLQTPPVFNITPRRDYIERLEYHARRLSEYLKQGRVMKDKGVVALNYKTNSAFGQSQFTDALVDGHRYEIMSMLYHRFALKNYPFLLTKLVEACDNTGLEPNEFVLELDFPPIQNGIFPLYYDLSSFDNLLDDLTIFKFVPAQGYIDGSRPEEADWFSNYHQDPYHREKKKKAAVALMKERTANQPMPFAGFIHFAGYIESFQNDERLFNSVVVQCYRTVPNFTLRYAQMLSQNGIPNREEIE